MKPIQQAARHTRSNGSSARSAEAAKAPVRTFWSGTITFGLVSIPVDLLTGVRGRQKSLKMVSKDGKPLGRQYHCSQEDKKLSADDLVRGYETDSGKMVVITDEEFEEVAPEMTRDIELRRFVPLEQIPPIYFNRPYYLAPAGRSVKAYHLLAETMERTGRVGIGSFVMRGHEHLVAIISENGVLRAETLRYADEIRTPEYVGLPKRARVPAKKVTELAKEIDGLTQDSLDVTELEDRDAQALQALAQEKEKRGEDVISIAGLEEEAPEGGGAQIIDLMQLLRKSLSKNTVVNTAQEASEPIPFPRPNQRAKSPARTNGARSGKPQRATAKSTSSARSAKRSGRSHRSSGTHRAAR